nr:ABATE domain-containing protein [Rhizobium tropici]
MSLPHRIAGNIAPDLANTVSWRGTDREIDHLASAEDILAWAKEASLVDRSYALGARECDVLVNRTHALRLAIGQAGAAIAQGREPPVSALNIIRDFAASALRAAAISGVPAIFKFEGLDQIAGAIAWTALDLLRGDELFRLK